MKLIRDGDKGGGGGGEREIIYLSLHCLHQNDTCIKMDSDESHFNVSVRSDSGQSHKTVSTDRNLFEEKGEPKQYRTEVLPLPLTIQNYLNQSSENKISPCSITLEFYYHYVSKLSSSFRYCRSYVTSLTCPFHCVVFHTSGLFRFVLILIKKIKRTRH